MHQITGFKSMLFALLLGGALVAAAACGGEEAAPTATPKAPAQPQQPAPAPTAIPAPTAAAAPTTAPASAPTATAAPAPTATATTAPAKQAPRPEESGIPGGELNVSLLGDISTLDVHRTTGTTANTIAYAVQEFLFGYDLDLIAQPLLVDTWQVSSDGKRWEFKLRPDVKFHNGRTLTAEDAVKSWKRWAERDNFGSIVFGFVDTVNALDPLRFEVKMVEPTALVLEAMARIGGYYPYIMPPEMYNVPAAQGASEMIGTGPYKFDQYVPGGYARIVRFNDYKPVSTPFSFMSGKKVAYFDSVKYVIVPDANARIAALRVGQIDIIDGEISSEFYDSLATNPELTITIIRNNSSRDGAWIDHVDGVFTDKRIRQAFAMAYPVEDALRAAAGDQRFWTTCPSMMLCGTKWGGFSDYSEGIYNARGKGGLDKAKQLVKDAGAVGKKVTVLSPQDRPRFSGPAEISRQVLAEIGLSVEFKATDWATQTNWREKPELWDVFHTAGGGAWGSNPLLNSSLGKNTYWNKYQDESGQMTAGMNRLARATSAAQQLQIVKDMQKVFWEDIPYVSFGDVYNAVALRKTIVGARTDFGMPFNVFNAWRAK
jgi:peptide/nickel transport system substrate-binding protein